ncbi:MAG: ABC transporter permease [Planctomycetaceae bacterium]|nr:ABC transporter permease [Planctomycetaceae bacterium]
MKQSKTKKSMPAWFGPLMALIILTAILAVVTDRFIYHDNIMNVLRQSSINALVALGMLFVLLTGGIDLSVGSVVALSACVMAVVTKATGITSAIVLIPVGLLCGVLVGTINGLLFTKAKLPHPFVSTLGMMMMLRGVCLLITGARPITGFSGSVLWLGRANFIFPICFILVIIMCILYSILLNRTTLGRQIYAVGGNKEAARLSGIDVDKTVCFVYIVSGFMAALAGIVLLGRISTAYALSGDKYEMDAIAACVIGGASFNGGVGTVLGTLIGAMMIGVLRNGLNLLGAKSDVTQVVIGAVIILAVYIDVMRARAAYNLERNEQARAMEAEEAQQA